MLDSSNRESFSGKEEASIDDKGRLLVAKTKRDILGKDFVLAISPSGVLAAYPKDIWDGIDAEIKQASLMNPGRNLLSTLFVGTAHKGNNFDAQGRVLIPRLLREEGKVADKVVIVGATEKVEIWSKAEREVFDRDPFNYNKARFEGIAAAYRMLKE